MNHQDTINIGLHLLRWMRAQVAFNATTTNGNPVETVSTPKPLGAAESAAECCCCICQSKASSGQS